MRGYSPGVATTPPTLEPLVISAPFGNYVQPSGATPTLGTFTLAPRPGRVRRVLATVRYCRSLEAWVNRIGLRNPGIAALESARQRGRIATAGRIVSVHGFDAAEWRELIDRTAALGPAAIELNMSCPNVGEVAWPDDLFPRAAACPVPVIVKLPPIRYAAMVADARAAGLAVFHGCNTLPVPAGGMSGAPLKPLTIECLRALRGGRDGDALTLIGGGGVRAPGDVDNLADAGADRVAVGSKCFDPRLLVSHRPLAPIRARARERFA